MLFKLVNKNTNEVQEVIWTVAEKEKFLSENPDWYNCLDKVPTFVLKGEGWFKNSRNTNLKGQDALDNALRERDAIDDDVQNKRGKFGKADYHYQKASEKIQKEM